MTCRRRIVATAALPYANGDIHLGHMVEHFQVDFWTRFQRLRGHECLFICADDTHGTPIMVNAAKQGITPEALIERCKIDHLRDFAAFQIAFDNYSSTNTPLNRQYAEQVYKAMRDQGHVDFRSIEQLYCEHDKMFLPDRFVRGTCPKCKTPDQYGDACESCGTTYQPTELLDGSCSMCGTKPVLRESEHVFFKLNDFRAWLKGWVANHTQPEVTKKLDEWLKEDLRDWDISRDAPYFGFEIPDKPGKFFYVWVDAPIGYISSTAEWCERHGRDVSEFWKSDSAELYHFIGKDIVYFHTLFWPAMLKTAGFATPTRVFVHGFLTVDGVKMSKSKGTFILAKTYLKHLDPSYLRYYMACKLSDGIDDLDLNFDDFVSRVNADLIGKITNVASRGAQMLSKRIDGQLGKLADDGRALVDAARAKADEIAACYEARQMNKVMLKVREIADAANKYFDDYEPWKLIKEEPEKTREVLTAILNVFRLMTIYLKPVLPEYADKVAKLFGEEPYVWNDLQKTLESGSINEYEHLATRIDAKQIAAIVAETKQDAEALSKPTGTANAKAAAKSEKQSAKKVPEAALDDYIDISDFAKIKLRVGKVLKAEEIPEAEKLLRLTVDVGEEKPRTIMAGIKAAYKAADVEGMLVVVVANLRPRKMKFGVSEGMVMAAGPGGKDLFLISPNGQDGKVAKPGDDVG